MHRSWSVVSEISVVIPSYNGGHNLDKCLDAVERLGVSPMRSDRGGRRFERTARSSEPRRRGSPNSGYAEPAGTSG